MVPLMSLLYRREEEKRLDTIIEQINLQVDIIFWKDIKSPNILDRNYQTEVDAHP